jgi:hypothetical protein
VLKYGSVTRIRSAPSTNQISNRWDTAILKASILKECLEKKHSELISKPHSTISKPRTSENQIDRNWMYMPVETVLSLDIWKQHHHQHEVLNSIKDQILCCSGKTHDSKNVSTLDGGMRTINDGDDSYVFYCVCLLYGPHFLANRLKCECGRGPNTWTTSEFCAACQHHACSACTWINIPGEPGM